MTESAPGQAQGPLALMAPMRIAMVNWGARSVGGAETYIGAIVNDLAAVGHHVAFWHEREGPLERRPIPLPPGAPKWDASLLGLDAAIEQLRLWKPDVTLTHGVLDPSVHDRLLAIAPAVFFAHAYYGTCISGLKTWKAPRPVPCTRTLGPPCLLHYYPHRCGGLNPITMFREYGTQRRALERLRRYDALVVASRHMREEYLAHGFDPTRVHVAQYYMAASDLGDPSEDAQLVHDAPRVPDGQNVREAPYELLFVGRMDLLKGGDLLLAALPAVARELDRPVRLTLIGDGPARARWERRASKLRKTNARVGITFAGWLQHPQILERLRASHLLVVPSVWPEPFGLVGIEAGTQGVPAVAFDVGGIREWLREDVNGRIATGDRPTVASLSAAIVRAVRSPAEHQVLRLGARRVAREFTASRHVGTLLHILRAAVSHARGEADDPSRDAVASEGRARGDQPDQ